jgi:hypothetical protein
MRSLYSLSICICIHYIVDSQSLGQHVPAKQNTQETIKELLELSFSMLYISYRRKAGEFLFPQVLVSSKLFSNLYYITSQCRILEVSDLNIHLGCQICFRILI